MMVAVAMSPNQVPLFLAHGALTLITNNRRCTARDMALQLGLASMAAALAESEAKEARPGIFCYNVTTR